MTKIENKSAYAHQLRNIITFRFLTDRELELLTEAAEIQTYEEGEPVVEEGEISPLFYGIIEGSLGVAVTGEEESEVYVNTLGPGDVFGEAGMFMSVKRTATVRAQGPSVLICLHRKDLARFIRSQPEAGNKILLVVIYSLLRKLKLANQELAYERKSDLGQDEIDAMVQNLLSES